MGKQKLWYGRSDAHETPVAGLGDDMKNAFICLILAVMLMQAGCLAEEQTAADDSTLYLGMPPEAVEAIWGSPVGTDSHTGTLRWYTKDGHTLICGYSWCDVQRGVWHNGRYGDDVWGLAEWVEFNSRRKQVGGTIPASETVWKAAWQIARWNEQEYNHLSQDEQSAARIHEIGSGAAYAAKITGDGWIVEQDIIPVPIPCLGQGADSILVPAILMILQSGLFLFAVYSLLTALPEAGDFMGGKRKKQTLWMGPWLGLLIIPLTSVGVIASFVAADGWMICWLDIPFLCMACVTLNMRIDWDTEGFEYRTAMRRHISYEFSDIRQAKLVGDIHAGRDLMLKMGRRRVLLDYMMGLPAFLSVYNNWRSKNGLLSVTEEQEKQWRENYRRHGPFGRKLDRISGGRVLLVLSLMFGAFFAGVGLWTAASNKSLFVMGVILLLVGVALPLLYIYAVAHMNKKILRWYYRGRIRPDPEQPHKRKRYRRRQ